MKIVLQIIEAEDATSLAGKEREENSKGEALMQEIGSGILREFQLLNCGAISSFYGVTRRDTADIVVEVAKEGGAPVVGAKAETSGLFYEAYTSMALKVMDEIAREAKEMFPSLEGIAMIHKLGWVPVGETSIIIITCSPHRGDAIKSIGWIMDIFKAKVPIWKRESYTNDKKKEEWKANPESKV